MAKKIVYEEAQDVCSLVEKLVEALEEFRHIDTTRVYCTRSKNTRTKAIARIYGLPRIWQKALNQPPAYIIEVVSENYDNLDQKEKIETIIHELLHIPKGFTGGLRPHGKYVNQKIVRKLYRKAAKKLSTRKH